MNEFTSPILDEKRIILTEGEIVLCYRNNILFKVAKVTYEKFDDEQFQYSFTPYYDVIDALPVSIFQGIPGLNLGLRKQTYWRVNMTPVYVTERSPSANREGLDKLLKIAGMNYLNRLEWMTKTSFTYMGDSFITLPMNHVYETKIKNNSRLAFLSSVLRLLGSRNSISIRGIEYQDTERTTLIKVYFSEYMILTKKMGEAINRGQQEAKDKGVYKGRKKLLIDLPLLEEKTDEGKSQKEIANALHVSRTTLYRYRKEKRQLPFKKDNH